MEEKPKGLDQWLAWIEQLKQWVKNAPPGLSYDDYHEVFDVPHSDLKDVAQHFGLRVYPENYKHCQWVEVEWEDSGRLTMYSTARRWTYEPIEE